MKGRLLAIVMLLVSGIAAAQTITTVAGGGVGDGRPAAQAGMTNPVNIVLDGAGNLYIADPAGQRVRRVDAASGVITTIAGTGVAGVTGDGGPANQAAFAGPSGLALDAQGRLYISNSNTVRRVDLATGIATSVAGVATQFGFLGDGGPALSAWFGNINQIAVDAAGNLYITDGYSHRIRRIAADTGIVTSVAGNGLGLDGTPAVNASLGETQGIAFDAAGNYYVSENNRIRRIAAGTGIITTVAGTGTAGFSGDGGPATAATFNNPGSLAVDAAGNLFVSDRGNLRIRRIDAASGIVTTVGGGGAGGDGGPATAAAIPLPQGIAVDAAGRIYVSDRASQRVRRIAAGLIEPFAGSATPFTGDGLPATEARLVEPGYTGSDAAGNLFIAEPTMGRIRRVDAATGIIQTYAGTGAGGSTGDGGIATAAAFTPSAMAVAANGDVYIGDSAGFRLRRISAATGIIETVANEGVVNGMAVDAANNVYFGSTGILRMRDGATGIVSTVASVDVAQVAIDEAGAVYIGAPFPFNSVVRLAGGGVVPVMTNGSASGGLAVRAGALFFASFSGLGVSLRVPSDGTLLPFAGIQNPQAPLGDAGPADAANLGFGPLRLSLSGSSLYISAGSQGRIRKVSLGTLIVSPGSLAFDGRLPQTTSLARRATLLNLDAGAAALGSVSTAPPFAVTTTCGATLASGATCTLDATFSPLTVGSFSGSAQVVTGSGTRTVSLSGVGELSLVTFYYESILRRAPDSIGKPYWDGERARLQGLGANVNETWFAMSSSFFGSGEYVGFNRDATGYVTDLYRTFFNRAPDAPGLQFWISQIANGMPREAVLAEFQLSGEFAAFTQGYFGNTAARAEVDMVMDFYRGLLGRLPDTGGYNAWVQQFRTAQCQSNPLAAVTATAESISEAFATSGEYLNKNRSNGQYVGDLYNAFLRRGGDLGGVVNWINSLANNTFTRKQVRDNFRASTEFTTRLSQVAAQGCLP